MLQFTLSQKAAEGREECTEGSGPSPDVDNEEVQPSTSTSSQPPPKKVKKTSSTSSTGEIADILRDHFTRVRREQEDVATSVIILLQTIKIHCCEIDSHFHLHHYYYV